MYEAHYGPTGGHFQLDMTAKKIQQLGIWSLEEISTQNGPPKEN